MQNKIQPHEMPITPEVMKSVSAARDRYRPHLEEQKKGKVRKEIDSRKQEMINELQSVKENCQGMQDLIREFDIKFVDMAKIAEKNNYAKFLIEGSALKRKTEEKRVHLGILKKRNLYLIEKSFPKQDSISYTRDKQITNNKKYTHIECS